MTESISSNSNYSTLNKHKQEKNDFKSVKHEQMRVKANDFVNKLKALDDVSNSSSSARMKLMELRHGNNVLKKDIKDNSFEKMMAGKSYSIKVKDKAGNEFYIFSPFKIKTTLDSIEIKDFVSSHMIVDSFNSTPTLKKIADFQQYTGTDITGYIDEKFFDFIIELYINSMFKGDIDRVTAIDKLMSLFAGIIGNDEKTGRYIKAIVIIKTILMAGEDGKFGNFDKMNELINNNLPEVIKTKFKIRLSSLKRRYIAFNIKTEDRTEKISNYIKEEFSNMSINDKIKILDEFLKIKPLNNSHINDIIDILKSIVGFKVNEKDKEVIIKTVQTLSASINTIDQATEIEGLYNKIRLHYINYSLN